tara:strand:- start:165 stop:539 length:375 start_codon:yes stop_codon:yes gene_type:complete
MKLKNFFKILILFLLWCNTSLSEIRVETYLKYKDSSSEKVQKQLDIVLIHLGAGIMSMNVELDYNKRNKIFCSPDNLAFNAGNYSRFIDDEIKYLRTLMRIDELNDFPIAMILISHLKKAFPCK